MRLPLAVSVSWISLSCAIACGAGEKQPASEFIFEEAPFESCHASTIVETSDGTLVAAWFGGTREGHSDVGIWLSRREGEKWTRPKEVATGVQYLKPDGSEHRYPCWNPVLFQPKESSLLLFYKCGPSPDAWWGMLMRSGDGGKSWSFPRRLPEGIIGPVKNKPIALSDGRLLCGSSTEDDGWRVHFEATPDLGRTWTRIGPINDGKEIAAIQPSLLRLSDRKLRAIGRSKQGKLWMASSEDNGLTWGPMTLTDLPNPNSGTDAVTLADGRHLLVFNNTPQGRTPLNVAVSADASTWDVVMTLEEAPGEYSYPAVIQTRDKQIHIAYTWQRKRIKHVTIDPASLQ